MPMGGGISATNEPKASFVSCHTSTSIPFGCGSATRSKPGFGGVVFARAKRRYFGAVVVVRNSDAPRLVSWWFRGCPARCAPTTASWMQVACCK